MSDRKIVYTGGTFDLFHAGHVNFLRQCWELGDVYVALNTDEFIKEYKGKAPIYSYKDRQIILETNMYVSCVIPNTGGADSKPTIERVNPDIIAVGTDWAKKDYYKQMSFTQEWLDENGYLMLYLPYTDVISTTEAKKRVIQHAK